MRWDNLFDDLESQLESERKTEETDLQAEEERLRLARMALRDRIVAVHESARAASPNGWAPAAEPIRLQLLDGTTISVHPQSFGKDWFQARLVDSTQKNSNCIVPLAAVAGIVLSRQQVSESTVDLAPMGRTLSARLGLAFALRDLCRRRAAVDLHLALDSVHGTIDRVGRDHVDLAVHESGSPRREDMVTQYRVVPFHQLLLVRLP